MGPGLWRTRQGIPFSLFYFVMIDSTKMLFRDLRTEIIIFQQHDEKTHESKKCIQSEIESEVSILAIEKS